ncbi:TIR domain-containing protein [Turicibacter sanguinis]|uniref:TIR domain-containing protein n=1 Tax=Turicibacter sanguinis TaxID=154288 RepID=UPI002943EB34|nr:TIR domain-containing protein [Turicibacter sanguinis]
MSKMKIFVSFDFENDRHYKYLLEAWSKNPNFEITFDDKSSREINSWNISVVKGALSKKIKEADVTLVIVGAEANKLHKDYKEIGYRNWQNFEIARSKEYDNKLVGVKLNMNYESPTELLGSGAKWAYSFELEKIIRALNS